MGKDKETEVVADVQSDTNNLEIIEKNLMQKISEGFETLITKVSSTVKPVETKVEKPTETKPDVKVENPLLDGNGDTDDYAKMYARVLELEKEKLERQALDERTAELKKVETINKDIATLIKSRAIASSDTATVEKWKKLLNADYDTTKALLDIEVEKAKSANKEDEASDKPKLTKDEKEKRLENRAKTILNKIGV